MTRLEVSQGVHLEECVAYRIHGEHGDERRHLGLADAEHVAEMVAAFQAAMPGWKVTSTPETFTRWVSGGDPA